MMFFMYSMYDCFCHCFAFSYEVYPQAHSIHEMTGLSLTVVTQSSKHRLQHVHCTALLLVTCVYTQSSTHRLQHVLYGKLAIVCETYNVHTANSLKTCTNKLMLTLSSVQWVTECMQNFVSGFLDTFHSWDTEEFSSHVCRTCVHVYICMYIHKYITA